MNLSLAGREVALFDSLDAPFWFNAARFVQEPTRESLAPRPFRCLAGKDGRGAPAEDGVAFGFTPAGAHAGIFSTGRGRIPVGKCSPVDIHLDRFGRQCARAVAGLEAEEWAGQPPCRLNQGVGRALRPGRGRRLRQALFQPVLHRCVGSLRGRWLARRCDCRDRAGNAGCGWRMLQVADKRTFSSVFSVEAARPLGRGMFSLSLQQPLRVEGGHPGLSFATGRTPESAVKCKRVAVGLEPSDRQLDFGVDRTRAVLPGAVWRVGAVLSHEPGLIAGRAPEIAFLSGLHVRF